MALLIGLDVGTSGLKAIAVDAATGAVAATEMVAYPLNTPHPGWAEQQPDDFAKAGITALRRLTGALGARAREVRAIGLTGQMHSAVLLDAAHQVVRPAILWCDSRTSAECRAITDRLGHAGLHDQLGNLALEGFTLPKLLWVRDHEPETFDQVATVLMPKDYLGWVLTGEIGTDDSDASGTLAFDPGRRQWSDEVIEAFGLPRHIFPAAGPSTTRLGLLRDEIADQTGLPAALPVARGAADNAAAAVGLGVIESGLAMVSIGTSGVVLVPTDDHVVEPHLRLHSFCHAVPGAHYLMGVVLAAGGALRWYRDVLCDGERLAAELRSDDPYAIICEAASTSRPGAGGVVFLPYLMGERTPHHDAAARAALVGLTARTTKADISRAVLEGITYGLCDSLALVRDLAAVGGAPQVTEARLSGGGAQSAFWRQLLADVLDCDIVTTTSTEGPAYGAALLGGCSAGVFDSVAQACAALVHPTARLVPEPVTRDKYAAVHHSYRQLYDALRAPFATLQALDDA
jgi:xylulokinase